MTRSISLPSGPASGRLEAFVHIQSICCGATSCCSAVCRGVPCATLAAGLTRGLAAMAVMNMADEMVLVWKQVVIT